MRGHILMCGHKISLRYYIANVRYNTITSSIDILEYYFTNIEKFMIIFSGALVYGPSSVDPTPKRTSQAWADVAIFALQLLHHIAFRG